MPRGPRSESPSKVYHVMLRGVNHEHIFLKTGEKQLILQVLKDKLEDSLVELYGYCVMETHMHLLIRAEKEYLAAYMKRTAGSYAKYYNGAHDRNGQLFQNRFRSECIDTERYYWQCLRYIHNNPVKAGMVTDMDNYPYSSIAEYEKGERKMLCTKAFQMYGKKYKQKADSAIIPEEVQEKWFLDLEEDELRQRRELFEQWFPILFPEYNTDKKYHTTAERQEVKDKLFEKLRIPKGEIEKFLRSKENS